MVRQLSFAVRHVTGNNRELGKCDFSLNCVVFKLEYITNVIKYRANGDKNIKTCQFLHTGMETTLKDTLKTFPKAET